MSSSTSGDDILQGTIKPFQDSLGRTWYGADLKNGDHIHVCRDRHKEYKGEIIKETSGFHRLMDEDNAKKLFEYLEQ